MITISNLNNLIIRNALFATGTKYWQLARDVLDISEATLSRKLRNELPEDEQRKIAAQIEAYAAQKGGREDGH